MGIADFIRILFAMSSEEIDELEFVWQIEDTKKAEALFKAVLERLEGKGEKGQ